MESFDLSKGHLGLNPSSEEDPSTEPFIYPITKTAPKRRVRGAIFSLIFLTLIIATMIGFLVHESAEDDDDEEEEKNKAPEWIRTVCSVTPYPHRCFSSTSKSKTRPAEPDPEFILNVSLRVAVKRLSKVSLLSQKLILKSNDPRTESALKDCGSLFDHALSQLNQSLAAVEMEAGEVVLTEAKIADVKTWISAAMTDEQTCLHGLEEMGSTVLDKVKAKVQKSDKYMSNSLAILSNLPTLCDKLSRLTLTMH